MKKILAEWRTTSGPQEGFVEWLLIRKMTDGQKVVASVVVLLIFLLCGYHFWFYAFFFPIIFIITIIVMILEIVHTPELRLAAKKNGRYLQQLLWSAVAKKQNWLLLLLAVVIGGGSAAAYQRYQPQEQEQFVANQASAIKGILDVGDYPERYLFWSSLKDGQEIDPATLAEMKLDPKLREGLVTYEQLINRLYSYQLMDNFDDYAKVELELLQLTQQLRQDFPEKTSDGTFSFMQEPDETAAAIVVAQRLVKEKVVMNTRDTSVMSKLGEWLPLVVLLVTILLFVLNSMLATVDLKRKSWHQTLPVRGYVRISERIAVIVLGGCALLAAACGSFFGVFSIFGNSGNLRGFFPIYFLDQQMAVTLPSYLLISLMYFVLLLEMLLFLQALFSWLLKSADLPAVTLVVLVFLVGIFGVTKVDLLSGLNFLFYPLLVAGSGAVTERLPWYGVVFAGVVMFLVSVGCFGWLHRLTVKGETLDRAVEN